MKKLIILLFLSPFLLKAQTTLLPHIGLVSQPQTTDVICIPQVYTGEMDTSGFAEGDIVPDFTLYKANGDSVRLSDVLAAGKPVLLVGGNYTCPVFRQKIIDLNDITNYYAGQLQVYLIYGIEAHPIVDPSPYSGIVWVTSGNFSEGVLYEQPDNYGERLDLLDSLLSNYSIVPEILIDGPCNEWWLNFGPAPNNAYLIDTNGVVSAKQGWFNRAPDNMWCEIDSLLGTNSGNCIAVGDNGSFSFTLDNDSVDYDIPGNVLSIHGMLRNLSSTDNVNIVISKYFIDIPSGWQTALCADICYSSSASSANVIIAPSDSLAFTFYFYSDPIADSGFVKVRFKNLNLPSNTIYQNYSGVTSTTSGFLEQNMEMFTIYPNPTTGLIYINLANNETLDYEVLDILGNVFASGKLTNEISSINISELTNGFYFFKAAKDNKQRVKIIKN